MRAGSSRPDVVATVEIPAVVRDLQRDWDLGPDGVAWRGDTCVLVPALRRGVPPAAARAVLKVGLGPGRPDPTAHVVLRRWGGDGAVRMLAADPARRALLLERLDPDTDLSTVELFTACEEIGRLLARLAVPALPQLLRLSEVLAATGRQLADPPAALPRRFVDRARGLAVDLAAEPDIDARVVHTDLHDRHVLAGGRTPWTAIAPTTLSGDVAFGVAPVLWQRWDAAARAHDVRAHLRYRIDAVCDTAGVDPARARAFAEIRLVRRAIEQAGDQSGSVTNGAGGSDPRTATVTALKAMQS